MSSVFRTIMTNKGICNVLGPISSTGTINLNGIGGPPNDITCFRIQREVLNYQESNGYDYSALWEKSLKFWDDTFPRPDDVQVPFVSFLNLKASFGYWLDSISATSLNLRNFIRAGSSNPSTSGGYSIGFGKEASADHYEHAIFFYLLIATNGTGIGWFALDHRVSPGGTWDYQYNAKNGGVVSVPWLQNQGLSILNIISSPDPNDGGGTSDPKGAQQEPDFDLSSDDIPVPNMSEYLVTTNAGIVTLYKASQTRLELFSDELWSSNAWQSFLQFFGSPGDLVMGLGVIPFDVPAGEYRYPKIGGYTFTTSFQRVTNQFHEIDCGTLNISEYWGNYLDYSPYTRINIYLPYIGTRELDVDEVMGHTLFCRYHVDVYNGNCVAFLGIDGDSGDAVRYQFSGNCLQQLPISANSYDAMVAAGIQLATAAVGGIAAGATVSAGSAGLGAGETAAVNNAIGSSKIGLLGNLNSRGQSMESAEVGLVMASKPKVEKNGSLGASIGQMSVQFPFITRELANQSLPENYMYYKGYPLNATATLGSQSGFTKVDDIRLNNLVATVPEVEEIYKLLKEGVII